MLEETLDVEAIQQEYAKILNFLDASTHLKERREQVRARIAPSPRTEVFREHGVTLYRYERQRPATLPVPMLIIPSFVNKPFIMDFLENESFVAAMLERGLDVFILEWGDPTPGQRRWGFDVYLRTYLDRAVRRVLRATGAEQLTLAGYCLGGVVATLHATRDADRRIRNLVTMVSPTNFVDHGLLSWWARKEHFDIDRIVDTYGNMPASFFSSSFPWLLPGAYLTKMRTLYDRHADDRFLESFLALDIWGTENTPFPGQVFRELISLGYQQNVLIKDGTWPLENGPARLAEIRASVLVMSAQYDHIAPSASCAALEGLVGSDDCTAIEYPTSHLGIALGKDATGASTPQYWDDLVAWLSDRP